MNVISLTGNSTKDVELKYLPSGGAVASGSIAVRRDFKNKQSNEYETDFINFTAFGKTGELMADYVKKGDKFGINGRLQIRKYEQDGQTRYFTEVVVAGFDFPDKKRETEGTPDTKYDNGPIEISDQDLPF